MFRIVFRTCNVLKKKAFKQDGVTEITFVRL